MICSYADLTLLGWSSASIEDAECWSGDFPLIASSSAWASKYVLLPALEARPVSSSSICFQVLVDLTLSSSEESSAHAHCPIKARMGRHGSLLEGSVEKWLAHGGHLLITCVPLVRSFTGCSAAPEGHSAANLSNWDSPKEVWERDRVDGVSSPIA